MTCWLYWQPSPRRINPTTAIPHWLKLRFSAIDYSADLIYADNEPGQVVLFEPDLHQKYNAKVLFRNIPMEGASTALNRWQKTHPSRRWSVVCDIFFRLFKKHPFITCPYKLHCDWLEHTALMTITLNMFSASAQAAYTDFIRGLEAIGAQEHVTGIVYMCTPEKVSST